jgi:hypothetical protein
MVLIEVVNEDFERQKLLCLVLNVKYYGLAVGIKVFFGLASICQ